VSFEGKDFLAAGRIPELQGLQVFGQLPGRLIPPTSC
jgi:hypothetical protein